MYKYFIVLVVFFGANFCFADNIDIQMLNMSDGQSMVFSPGFKKVNVGDTVTFKPTDPAHNSQSVFVPDGAKPWKGAMNEEVSYKFEKEGVYVYECLPHSALGMMGIIQVGSASNKEKAEKFLEKYKGKVAVNKERIDKYFNQVR